MLCLIRGGALTGEGRGFAIPLMAFFNIHVTDIHHILTFHMSGDTWPAAFYWDCFGRKKPLSYSQRNMVFKTSDISE